MAIRQIYNPKECVGWRESLSQEAVELSLLDVENALFSANLVLRSQEEHQCHSDTCPRQLYWSEAGRLVGVTPTAKSTGGVTEAGRGRPRPRVAR